MRTTLDFAPLFRSSIGFDRTLNVLEAASRVESTDNWPPYDIVKSGEDDYRITMAVAGFAESDLNVVQEHNMLMVTGQKADGEEKNRPYLYRGIAGRSFQRRFELADYMKVTSASLVNCLLTINLKRDLPEAMKPRRIAIATDSAPPKVKTQKSETPKLAA